MFMRLVLLGAALIVVSLASAQEKPALKSGSDLPGPMRPYIAANGKFEGKFHCPLCEHGLTPGVLIVARDPKSASKDDPFPKLLKEIDSYIVEKPASRLHAAAVFLYPDLKDVVTEDDTRLAKAELLRNLRKDLGLEKLVLAVDTQAGLQACGYDLDPQAQVIVVLYDKLKIQSLYSFAEGKLTDAEVKTIVAEIKDKLAPVRKR